MGDSEVPFFFLFLVTMNHFDWPFTTPKEEKKKGNGLGASQNRSFYFTL
jgi:hypothetical protein